MPPAQESVAFFVWDPTLTTDAKDDLALQDAKIVYYSPRWTAKEDIRMRVSLIQGLVEFTRKFEDSPGARPLHSIRTKKHSFALLEPEPNKWLSLVIKHPKVAEDARFAPVLSSAQEQEKAEDKTGANRSPGAGGGGSFSEYVEEPLHEETASALLQNVYRVFRLLHGPLTDFLEKHGKEKLGDLLEDFIPSILESISSNLLDSHFSNAVFYQLDGFHYGPVERNTYSSIATFLHRFQEQFGIKNLALLYKGHLIYSGLDREDMKVLYTYLVTLHTGKVSNTKLNAVGRIPTAACVRANTFESSSFGRSHLIEQNSASPAYLLGADPDKGSLFVPRVYLSDGSEGQLVALHFKGLLLVSIFEASVNVDNRLLKEVRLYVGDENAGVENLTTLQPIIERQFTMVVGADDEFRFLYYNHANAALRVSNHYSSGASGTGRQRGGRGKKSSPAADASAAARFSSLIQGMGRLSGGSDPERKEEQKPTHLAPEPALSEPVMDFLDGGNKELFLASFLGANISSRRTAGDSGGGGGKSSSGGGFSSDDTGSTYREVCLKEADRGWICAKRSLDREFYLLLDQPQMMLSKCQEETARFSAIHFSNIYMM